MRNKETLYFIVLLAFAFFFFCGCSSSRKMAKSKEQSSILFRSYGMAEDNLVLEYALDTTRECKTNVIVERTEYYPEVYFDTTINSVKQKIKSVEKRLATSVDTKKGAVEAKESKHEEAFVAKDSTKVEKKEIQHKEIKRTYQWWWILLLVLVVAFVFRKKFN